MQLINFSNYVINLIIIYNIVPIILKYILIFQYITFKKLFDGLTKIKNNIKEIMWCKKWNYLNM